MDKRLKPRAFEQGETADRDEKESVVVPFVWRARRDLRRDLHDRGEAAGTSRSNQGDGPTGDDDGPDAA